MVEKSKITFGALFKKMGTSAGTYVVIFTIMGMAFTAGIYFNSYVKNVEILDIKKANFFEIQTLSFEIESLKIENKELKIKITEYGPEVER